MCKRRNGLKPAFIGVSVCIFVALWLCLFGCVLQGPIRLEVL